VKEEYAIKFALSKKVEGIVLCPVQKDSKDIQLLKRINLPFVLIGRHFNTIETDYVIMDDSNGAFLATQYLIDMGRKSILYLNAHNYISSAVERKSGYQHALEKNNIDYNPELVREIDIVKNGDCHRVLKELKMENIHFDAVLSFSDLIAWQMIYFLNKEKITIPGDVAVIGFDNLQSSIYYPYSLTSVTYSKKKVADEVVRILMQKMEDNTWSKFEQIVIGTSLFIGEST
jgi:LacI family transcriptional regulator